MFIECYENRLQALEKVILNKNFDINDIGNIKGELGKIIQVSDNLTAKGLLLLLNLAEYLQACNYSLLYEHSNLLLSYGKQITNYYFMIAAYNYLGIYHVSQNNSLTSYDCLWNALCLLEEHKDLLYPFFYIDRSNAVYVNMSFALAELNEHEESLEYSLNILHKNKLNIDPTSNIILFLGTLTNCFISYYNLKQYQDAYKALKAAKKYLSQFESAKMFQISYLIWEYILTDLLNESEDADKLLAPFECHTLDDPCFDHIPYLLLHLLTQGKYKLFLKFWEPFWSKAKEQDIDWAKLRANELKLKYYELTNDTKGCNHTYAEIGKLLLKRDQERSKSQAKSLHTYLEMAKKTKQQQEFDKYRISLEYKSTFDELTGLANRHKLTEFCETAFKKAYMEKQSISVVIIDVDDFKMINDHYGHTEGDICLKKISNEISKTVTNPAAEIAARFGGDEFVIVRMSKTDEEILAYMKGLRESILNLTIPNEFCDGEKLLTISQGAVNKIPNENDNLTIFLKQADGCLYKTKENSKNNYNIFKFDPPAAENQKLLS